MSRKKQVNQKITALYCRISLDDGGDNESMSISNQKLMLKEFAEKNGMFQHEYYVDDGYTGRNFNRPAFQRMIADIEAGKIGCVITKDDCVIKALTPQTLENRHFSGIGTEFRAIWRPQRAAHIIGTS